MTFKNSGNLKYIFSTIKNSFLPALFLMLSLLMFYAESPYEEGLPLFFHYVFIAVTAITFSLLCIADRSKPLFSLLVGFVSYLIINSLKREYGENFIFSFEFQCLCFFLPLNLALLYFLPQAKLNTMRNTYLLLFLLFQACLLQHFGNFIKIIPHVDINIEAMPLWACAEWIIMLVILMISSSYRNTHINTGLFYAYAALAVGVLYSATSSGLTTFFAGFAIILLCASVLSLYHRYHYDHLEHVGSKISYLNNARSKFLYKYTVALFSIDNRDKLQQAIGENKVRDLEQMVVNSILKMPYDLTLYRYNESELIMVFQNERAKHAKEFADNIRHNIAASEFITADGKSRKITVSICVSEKTHKINKPDEVVQRAHDYLQKGHHFNCNITTIAD